MGGLGVGGDETVAGTMANVGAGLRGFMVHMSGPYSGKYEGC